MKKIKMLFYSAAFVLALSASFAFKPSSPKTIFYYRASLGAPCTSTTNICTTGSTLCTLSGIQVFKDKTTCQSPAFIMP